MGRKIRRNFSAAEVVEFWNNLLQERPYLPYFVPLILLVWAFERWVLSFSNLVPLAIAVWATVQVSFMISSLIYIYTIPE